MKGITEYINESKLITESVDAVLELSINEGEENFKIQKSRDLIKSNY